MDAFVPEDAIVDVSDKHRRVIKGVHRFLVYWLMLGLYWASKEGVC